MKKKKKKKANNPKPHTPTLQVAVRYLDTHETVLVSRCYVKCEEAAAPAVEGEESGQAYGAVYPGQSASFEAPPPYGEYSYSPPPGASLSADGSTVAWIGEDIGQQAALLREETRNSELHRAAVAAHRTRLGNAHRAGDGRLGPDQPGLRGERRGQPAGKALAVGPLPGAVRRAKTRAIRPGSSTKTAGRPATSCRA